MTVREMHTPPGELDATAGSVADNEEHMPRNVASIAAAAILATTLIPAGASAATTQSADRKMTRLAVTVISDASAARTALASGKKSGDAVTDITRALDARNALAVQARAAGLPSIVPVYEELDDTAVLTNAVKKNSSSHSTPPTVVRANAAELTFLAIDLDKAKAHLDAAKTAIAHANDQAAKDSLAAVGSDLVEESVVTDVPLLTAREDLSRAQHELKSDDQAAAMTDLRQASKSLLSYTKGEHMKDARLLASAIDVDTMRDTARPQSVAAKIDRWWSSVAQWARQSV
jgi:hypothetical protein